MSSILYLNINPTQSVTCLHKRFCSVEKSNSTAALSHQNKTLPVLSGRFIGNNIGQRTDICVPMMTKVKKVGLRKKLSTFVLFFICGGLKKLIAQQLYDLNSQLVATRQKSSCSLATSKGVSRDSGSTLSLPSAAVERLGLEAWRRMEPEDMQLGT